MIHGTRHVFQLVLCVLILCMFVTDVNCRGSRGGGSRGGRYSSRGSRSRGGSSRMSRGSSLYSRSTWNAAFIAGSVMGSRYYLRSSRYNSHPYDMPTICTNLYDDTMKNSSGARFVYFVCPRESDPEDHDYCCGNVNQEYCCKSSMDAAVIVGIVMGSIAAIIFISLIIFCIYMKIKPKKVNKTAPDNRLKTMPPSRIVNPYPMPISTITPLPPIGFKYDSVTAGPVQPIKPFLPQPYVPRESYPAYPPPEYGQ